MVKRPPKVVCGICEIPMILDTRGLNIAEISDGFPPREIYKTAGDKYVCPRCNVSVYTGFGSILTPIDDNFITFPVHQTIFGPNHSESLAEVEDSITELNMLKMNLEMKRDNLIAYDNSQLRSKIRKRKKK